MTPAPEPDPPSSDGPPPPSPPSARPWYDPRTWRLGRAWQLWLMALLTIAFLRWQFGKEAVIAAVQAWWTSLE